jgi:hypothetical protein
LADTKTIERNIPADAKDNKNLKGYSPQSIAKFAFGALFGTSIQIILGTDNDSALESMNLAENLLN